jgi:DNA primase
MDAVAAIKAKLSIEELVGRYCQLQKKGRNFVTLCPFHKDSHPSFLVSPDKGIAYCFACQTGGDIFSFYQAIENVDFKQALKDLAERTGVQLSDFAATPSVPKDEKERVRACLQAALQFYQAQLAQSDTAKKYLADRGIEAVVIEEFQLGVAPDSYTATYDHLLKAGFSRKEILGAGLGIQKELQEERIYDRFRNRLMIPIHDATGRLIAFGGRTLGNDDAKYINSSEGILYHKSDVLFGLHRAKDAIRDSGRVIIVEGYFDLIACHRAGIKHVVATSGTALTEQHAKLLKRFADTAILCLDSDRAGRDAAERAFFLLAAGDIHVQRVLLGEKDPDEALKADAEGFKKELMSGGLSYIDAVLQELMREDLSSPFERRQALTRFLSLVRVLPSAVERSDYLKKAAVLFTTTEEALAKDLQAVTSASSATAMLARKEEIQKAPVQKDQFSKAEVALALFLYYPRLRSMLQHMLPPEEGFPAALYKALKEAPAEATSLEDLPLPPEHRERANILHMYGEQYDFGEWSESLAIREIKKNCIAANRELLHTKMQEIAKKILRAKTDGKDEEKALLEVQYQEVMKLMKLAV